MSLVGTRPILPGELEQYELHHRTRIAIKPGITGMWQVSGRSDITDFEEVVRLTFVDAYPEYDIDFLEILRIMLNNLKQQIFHMAESNSLEFEIPKCHLRYTGQEDCMLFGYMNIIKEILKQAYCFKYLQLDIQNWIEKKESKFAEILIALHEHLPSIIRNTRYSM